MVVVTDDPYEPEISHPMVRYLKNDGRKDCVTGWNLAARNATGDIFIQVSDDLFPPAKWDLFIRSEVSKWKAKQNRADIVLNLLDERQQRKVIFHPVLTRASYEKTGYLYPPDFQSMHCDSWFFLYHRKYSFLVASSMVFWHHRHRSTHPVEVDDVMRIHESPTRYTSGLETLKKYIAEHRL